MTAELDTASEQKKRCRMALGGTFDGTFDSTFATFDAPQGLQFWACHPGFGFWAND